ncbi:MAG TPA: hypothetical protein VN833_02195, partial [Candidatus Acidoferrales bacterium]|nr:hypothetical protein [Candidatus Acidoferrales bacterium]
MGGRVTRSAQSKDMLRAKNLRQALECGASPSFIPPSIPADPQSDTAHLPWNPPPANSAVADAQYPADVRQQFLEQLFENSPDALVI